MNRLENRKSPRRMIDGAEVLFYRFFGERLRVAFPLRKCVETSIICNVAAATQSFLHVIFHLSQNLLNSCSAGDRFSFQFWL